MYKGMKTISIVLAGALIFGCLAGCQKDEKKGGEKTTRESVVEKYKSKKDASDTINDFVTGIFQTQKNSAMMAEDGIAYSEESIEYEAETGDTFIEPDNPDYPYEEIDFDTREYDYVKENPFVSTSDRPLSTFAADRDTASYSNVRGYIENGQLPPEGAVRIEEMINYFNYSYKSKPADGEKFAVYTEYTDCPWNKDTQLMMVGINTDDIDFEDKKPSNLVFLIDTSGSMYDDDKLPLVQTSFKMLAENLDKNDKVSIVTYAGEDTVVLSGTAGDEHYTITEALDSMTAEGCTNGGDAIITAYELAEKYYIEGGNNRVILATDGDLNVGLTSESDLVNLITEEKDTGIFLSVLGFGDDNLKDNKLEALADNGNGFYAYIDSEYEAKKALVNDMGGNLFAVAKDVKFQIEFNPANVKGYRLIGYENRALADTDFANDAVDGGEMGAGHIVTVLYEIVPIDSAYEVPSADKKYSSDYAASGENGDELATVNIRYKEIDEDTSTLMSKIVKIDSYDNKMTDDMSFVSAVAAYGMLLKKSEYSKTADYDMVLELAEGAAQTDEYKKQFVDMVKKTMELR